MASDWTHVLSDRDSEARGVIRKKLVNHPGWSFEAKRAHCVGVW